MWQNLGVKRYQQCLRGCFTYLISAVIIAAGFAAIVYLYKVSNEKTTNAWQPALCDSKAYDFSAATVDFGSEVGKGTYWQCYCYQELLVQQNKILTLNFASSGENPVYACKSWFENYSISMGIIYGVSFGITTVNIIITAILKYLSRCERPHTLTDQLVDAIQHTWVVVFVNYGLIILLINANYIRIPLPANSPVLKGPFKDFNTEWYGPVGTTIALSIIIEAVMPLA